jgi:hypothetical protein
VASKIDLSSPENFKAQIRELILASNHTGIVAEKMKEAAKR